MTASPTPFFAESANKSDVEHYAKSASCPEAPGTHAKIASVQPAPAAMPREDDVARALCIAQGNDPDFDYDPNGVSDLPGTNLCWKLYLGQARSVLALFAPVLAEKERHERTIAARDRRIARLVWAMDYARLQGVVFPADAEPKVVLSAAAIDAALEEKPEA